MSDVTDWQQAARDRLYAEVCCQCGYPARQLIAYAGWLCDVCAARRMKEHAQAARAQSAALRQTSHERDDEG